MGSKSLFLNANMDAALVSLLRRTSRKLELRSTSSLAITLPLALISTPAAAQMAAPGMIVENQPQIHGVAPPNMIVQNEPQAGAAPPQMIAENIPFSTSPPTLIVENQPQAAANILGNSVAATAQFDDTQVGFAPGVAEDVVSLLATEATINWTTTTAGSAGNAVTFLPAGRTLRFFSDSINYTVLNRVFTPGFDSAIRIDGSIISQINGATGGNVWFYSPGGIIAGATSAFDVGSLILSANDITTMDSTIQFRAAAGSSAAVTIEDGAQINANNNGSYVALVAPRVVQGGTVSVNGSAAYVGAEQADLSINQGLFDINVTVGTTDANGVVHSSTGTTTGASSAPTPAGPGGIPPTNPDAQAIYMVAVPKNTAITMLVGGNIGYQPAASAAVVNGKIILSAGHNVATTNPIVNPVPTPTFSADPVNNVAANIDFQGVDLNSTIEARSSNNIDLVTQGSQSINVNSNRYDLTATATNQIDFGGRLGGGVNAGRNVTLNAGSGATGGTVNIFIDRNSTAPDTIGRINIDGNLNVNTSARGADDFVSIRNNGGTGIGEDATSGNINVTVSNGGRMTVDGVSIFATVTQGGKGENQNGLARSGNVAVNLTGATSVINLTGGAQFATQAIAAGTGKIGGSGVGEVGSDSTAGNVSLTVQDGTFNSGSIGIVANANATSGSNPDIAQSNDAKSGDVALRFTRGTHNIRDINISSRATGGRLFNASGPVTRGIAATGNFDFQIDGAALTIQRGLSSNFSFSGIPAMANPADVRFDILNGANVQLGRGFSFRTSGNSGLGDQPERSANLTVNVDNSTFNFRSLSLSTSITRISPVAGTAANAITAGDLSLRVANGANVSGNNLFFSANADNQTSSGVANGGNILIDANNGQLTMTGSSFFDANGTGGTTTSKDAATRGQGNGGTVTFRLQGANGVMMFDNITANTDGAIQGLCGECGQFGGGGPGNFGDGGNATGGTISFDILGGTFVGNQLNLGSDGFGGEGGTNASGTAPKISPKGITTSSIGLSAITAQATGPQAATGGTGQGGNVVFNLNGGNTTIANLSVTANGIAGDGGFGSAAAGEAGGNGGAAFGGSATFNAISGNLIVTNTLTVAANANSQFVGGRGGNGNGTDGGDGGAATGGTATFNLNGAAAINASTVVVSTDAFGGAGGGSGPSFTPTSPEGVGGRGGNAVAGTATFNNTSGTLGFANLTVQSIGTGGQGGSSSGMSTDAATRDGGDGGDGTGGNAVINLNQPDATNPQYTVDASGIGGNGGSGLNGGRGGNAAGGIAALNVNNVAVSLGPQVIRARATGGAGGFVDGQSGNGGTGGNATGGTARLEVTGVNGSLAIAPGDLDINSSATGGNGAAGNSPFGLTDNGGNGGIGGDATGGTSEIIARTGGLVTIDPAIDFNLFSNATGGAGGRGGTVNLVSGSTGTAGDGGNGGSATAGTTRFLAQGGTITAGAVNFTSNATGGNGGLGGEDGNATVIGATGTGGSGTGGTTVAEVQEGSPGIITLGAVTMTASGTGGTGSTAGAAHAGRIELTDSSTDPAGLMTFASFMATAATTAASATSGFFVTNNSGAIAIAGDSIINVAGNAEFAFDGTGQMTVGGIMSVTSGGSILVSHTNNAVPTNSIDVVGTFAASAQGDFNSMAGSRIVAGGTATVRAEQNATVADIAGVGMVNISALQNVNVINAAVTGPPVLINVGIGQLVTGPTLVVEAGRNNVGPTYDPNFNTTISGNVTSTGSITVNAGGNAVFATGSNTVSDNGLTVRTGDDIIIQTGANVVAGANPATTPSLVNPFSNLNNLVLQAGGLTPLSSALLSPISSIIAAGSINANDFAVVMSANAIDGLGGTINASSIAAGINNAPSNAVITAVGQSNDNGILSGQCLQGNVCLGTVTANNQFLVGQAGVPVQLVIEGGNVNANDMLITIRRDLTIGTAGTVSTFNGTNQIRLESTEGDVELRAATLNSGTLRVIAAGSLLGTGTLTSTNDVGLTVGADINAAAINAGGQLTTAANIDGGLEAIYAAPGNFIVGSITQGAAAALQVTAAGNINVGQATLPNQDIRLTATGDAFLGSTTGTSNIFVQGVNAGFTNLNATNQIDVVATGGNVTGGNATSGGTTNLTATGGNLTAGNIVSGGVANFTSTGNTTFANGTAQNQLTINAGGAVSFTNATSNAAGIAVNAGTNVNAGTMNAATSNIVVAAGTATVGNAISGGDTSITGSSVTLNNGTVGGSLILNATAGNIGGTGTITAGDLIDLDATGNIDFGTLTATNAFTVDAGGGIGFTGATSTAFSIAMNATGAINGGNLDAATTNNLIAGGTATVGTANSGSNTNIQADTVTMANGAVGGSLILNATAGAVTVTGTATAGDAINLDATGNINFGSLTAANAFTVDSGGNVTFTNAASTNAGVSINAAGNINGGGLNAATAVNLTGAMINGTNATGSTIDITSTANVAFASLTGTNGVTIGATGTTTIGSVAATNENVGINSAAGIDISTINASGNTQLNAANGAIVVQTDLASGGTVTAIGQSVLLNAIGSMDVANVQSTAGNIGINIGGTLSVAAANSSDSINFNSGADALLAGDVVASNSLNVMAGNLIDVAAAAAAMNIGLNSADLNIGAMGQLGRSDTTQSVAITSNGTNRMVIGGTGTAGTFSIDTDEFGRIFSGGDLSIAANAVSADPDRTADLTIEDLTANVATGGGGQTDGNIGGTGSLTIDTSGILQVNGAFALNNATNGNNVVLGAGERFRLNAEGGNVAILDSNDALSGNLLITAPLFVAASDTAAGDIIGMTLDQIDTRLADNDGATRDDGFFQARGITINADNGIFIQNSGAGTEFDDRRGFVVGAGGLTIASPSNATLDIVINGIQRPAGGAATIGIAMINQTTINTSFGARSTINGCLIGNPASCGLIGEPGGPGGNVLDDILGGKTSDGNQDGSGGQGSGDSIFNPTIITLKDFEKYGFEPLIDEPVTGAGNDDLWVAPACDGNEKDCASSAAAAPATASDD